jgi:HSF-type DNA-binding
LYISWFRHSHYTSFQRQLNVYGFERITIGSDKNAYYHKNFLRGQYDLALLIKRCAIKGTVCRHRATPETEPDFYGMAIDTNRYACIEAPAVTQQLAMPQVNYTFCPVWIGIASSRTLNCDVTDPFLIPPSLTTETLSQFNNTLSETITSRDMQLRQLELMGLHTEEYQRGIATQQVNAIENAIVRNSRELQLQGLVFRERNLASQLIIERGDNTLPTQRGTLPLENHQRRR